MPAGDVLTAEERRDVDRAVRKAEQATRFEFSVFVGDAEGEPRAYATRLHNSLTAPARSVMLLVDPGERSLEIVTGGQFRARVEVEAVAAVAERMSGSLAAGHRVEALQMGIEMLAEYARR